LLSGGPLQLEINAAGAAACPLPDANKAPQIKADAFANTTPIALNTVFYPLGKLPRQFDAFYLGCPEAFSKIGAERLHFVAMDLSATTLDSEALITNCFDPTQRAVWIAEGLLMYLTLERVSSLMRTLKSLSAHGSQFVFTFMEKQSDGRIRFDSQSKLVDWWLCRRGEPFLWGITRSELVDLVRPWRVVRFFDHDDLRELRSGLADEPLAKGEVICLAES